MPRLHPTPVPHTLDAPPPPHVLGAVHVPHEAVRVVPQLSAAVTLPQVLPSRVQNAASVSAVQPHTLVALHVCGAVHVPHDAVREVPQLSFAVTLPQVLPSRAQNAVRLSALHVQTLLAAHVLGAVHVPHDTVREAPQLSAPVTFPQFLARRAQNAVALSATHPHAFAALHVWGNVHVPHEPTVRLVPQLSSAVTVPHVLPRREQNAVLVSAVHEHVFVVSHVSGSVHVPHDATVRLVPQLSVLVTDPHVLPMRAQKAWSVSATHAAGPQTLPALQTLGAAHVPHEAARAAPQLSFAVTEPQFLPSLVQNATFVSGVQAQVLVALHVVGAAQDPQNVTDRAAPQLSFAMTDPQALPSRAQKAVSFSGVHEHTFAAAQVCGAAQLPHEAVRAAPQLSVPVTAPQFLPIRVQKAVSLSGPQATPPVPATPPDPPVTTVPPVPAAPPVGPPEPPAAVDPAAPVPAVPPLGVVAPPWPADPPEVAAAPPAPLAAAAPPLPVGEMPHVESRAPISPEHAATAKIPVPHASKTQIFMRWFLALPSGRRGRIRINSSSPVRPRHPKKRWRTW
jgi:hypothetical protein